MSRRARRRAFLRWLAATGLTLPVWPQFAALADDGATPRELDDFLAALLAQFFPHESLEPAVYEQAALVLAGAIEADAGLQSLVVAGQDALDADGAGPWAERPAAAQRLALASQRATPFVLVLRGLGGLVFYSLPAVWEVVGYEGPSYEKGGYLERGFDDIDWLPGAVDGD